MQDRDRMILFALPLVALVVGGYLLFIGPKRGEISEVNEQVEAAQSALSAAEGQIAAGEQAEQAFSANYSELVTLGKAAPADGGQSSLLYDFAELGRLNEVEFRNFSVSAGGEAPPPPPPAETEGDPAEEPPAAEGTPVATTAPATEVAAAALPLGATVGEAGLPITPYTFKFRGSFFDMGSFFAGIDSQVSTRKAKPKVEGRLVTIDAFTFKADPVKGFPALEADFDVTTYILPPDEGLSAGATPAGPAPVGAPAPVAASNTETP